MNNRRSFLKRLGLLSTIPLIASINAKPAPEISKFKLECVRERADRIEKNNNPEEINLAIKQDLEFVAFIVNTHKDYYKNIKLIINDYLNNDIDSEVVERINVFRCGFDKNPVMDLILKNPRNAEMLLRH